jgi:hypothetical protein
MNGYFYSKRFDQRKYIERVNQKEIIAEKISNDYFNNNVIDKDAELINFAWETDNNSAEVAAAKVSSSYNVVVIGYTFPLYNRLTDIKYFNKITLSNNFLYLQDPEYDNIEIALKDNFGINTKTYKFKTIKKCDSFYVPSDIIDEEALVFKTKQWMST